jgi:5'-methylthioadenosine phosphorylase
MAAAIGIIGGSGLYEIDGFEKSAERVIETPFGDPSDALVGGMLGGREVWFLPRHGRGAPPAADRDQSPRQPVGAA